jgi:hypothetical protein
LIDDEERLSEMRCDGDIEDSLRVVVEGAGRTNKTKRKSAGEREEKAELHEFLLFEIEI